MTDQKVKYVKIDKKNDGNVEVDFSDEEFPLEGEALREQNRQQTLAAIATLNTSNEIRFAQLRQNADSFELIRLQFEMLSLKMDIVLNALSELLSADHDMQVLQFSYHFQYHLSKLLDELGAPPVATDHDHSDGEDHDHVHDFAEEK